jgi:hypothetical protein
MSTILASTIVNDASILLQDLTNIRWTQAELLNWLNDAQRQVLIYKPNSYTKNAIVQLIAGTRQSLPTDATLLIGATCNIGADGTTRGNAVRLVSREILDAQIPGWHNTSGASNTVAHYMYDLRDRFTFYVYPPQPTAAPTKLEIIYGASPANLALTDVISLDDIYAPVLLNYVLHRAYSKDAEYAQNTQLAMSYYEAFVSTLGGRSSSEGFIDPNANAKGNTSVV